MSMLDDPALIELLAKVHKEKGLDFSQYKEKSLLRRIQSRMNKYQLKTYSEYLRILETQPGEYNELVNALAINVTEYFRNPESFEAIDNIVIPRVIYDKRNHHHKIIRIWSCGCSSGDEPYSVAIIFLEKLGAARKDFLLTIIGTDIDHDALTEAKSLIYSRERLRAIDTGVLGKYFNMVEDNKYSLKNSVRSQVRFRYHDVIKDPPYRHCDIILCRNLLIYFNKQLQEEILLKFYECLNPGGFLVLGMVESLIGTTVNAFEHVNNRLRIYRRPERPSLRYEKEELLSQAQIDKIVGEMLDK